MADLIRMLIHWRETNTASDDNLQFIYVLI